MQSPDWFARRAEGSWDRREFVRLASGSVLGMSLPAALARASGTRSAAAKNVLVILEQGGLCHLDTWDPKPDAVAEHRSPFKPIATKVPGIQFTELLANTARIADKIAVVRSMHHDRGGADAHPNGTQYVLSGSHPSNPGPTMPDLGSTVSQILGNRAKHLPPYVMVPGNHEQAAETRTGFLPASTRVFKTGGRDLSDPKWKLEGLRPRSEFEGSRLQLRHDLRGSLESASSDSHGMNRFYDQAFDMLTSPKVAEAFDLNRESATTREKYGKGHRGACYLLGRKLVEAGVRFVTVDVRWPLTKETPGGDNLNWDHHDLIYTNGSCGTVRDKAGGEGRYGIGTWVMMGSTDRAFAALVDDLDQRGLLAETLVCFVTEFGRTPKLNKFQGRDHWTNAYSIAFAGAGVRGGQIIGKTEKDGGHVQDSPHTPEDYAATIYEKLGIDRTQPLYTASNRPVYFGHGGEPIPELM